MKDGWRNVHQNKKRIDVRTAAAFLLMLFCTVFGSLFLFAKTAYAEETFDLNKEVTLDIQYQKNGKMLSGATFRLYRAAEVSESLTFTPTSEFAAYKVSWSPKDSAAWKALAETLSGYVKRDGLTAAASGKTDKTGHLQFGADALKPGLYLVIGNNLQISRHIYKAEPFLICLPSYGETEGWDYAPLVYPKSAVVYDPPDGGGGDGGGGGDPLYISRRALKRWEDGNAPERPAEITVQLLKNGTVYKEAVLNEGNGWSASWSGLNRNDTWEVVEKDVPDGYQVSVGQEGITFVLTNTAEMPPLPPESTGEPPAPGSPESAASVTPAGALEKLPQTGVLWYPVPILAALGVLLFAIGWIQNRSKSHHTK